MWVVFTRGPQHQTRVITLPKPPPKPAAATTAAPKPAVKPPVKARKVKLAVTATRTSWLELRRGSRTGPVVYSGELPAGHSLRVTGTRIWARFGAAANLDIVVDGSRVPLQGTLEHIFTAT